MPATLTQRLYGVARSRWAHRALDAAFVFVLGTLCLAVLAGSVEILLVVVVLVPTYWIVRPRAVAKTPLPKLDSGRVGGGDPP